MSARSRFTFCLVGESTLLWTCADLLIERGHEIAGIHSTGTDACRLPPRLAASIVTAPPVPLEEVWQNQPFDYLLSIANPIVLSRSMLVQPSRMAINYHDSLLPERAGLDATTRAILDGRACHGITWHRMESRLDAGDILVQTAFDVDPEETTRSLDLKCFSHARRAFAVLLERIEDGRCDGTPQDLSSRTYAGRLKRLPDDGVIVWSHPFAAIAALVRAAIREPGTDGPGLARLWTGDDWWTVTSPPTAIGANTECRPPGFVVAASAHTLDIVCGDGLIRVGALRPGDSDDVVAPDVIRTMAGRQLPVAPATIDAVDNAPVAEPAGPGECEFTPVHQMVADVARRSPDSTAVECETGSISYAELEAAANRMAHYIAIAPGQTVAILLERSVEFVVAMLAVMNAGGCYVPLDAADTPERIADILGQAAPAALITNSRLSNRTSRIAVERRVLVDLEAADIAAANDHPPAGGRVRADNLAYTIFTSGSTGHPKGVMIEHGSLAWFIRRFSAHYGIRPDDRVLQMCSLAFDASIEEILNPLASGACVVLRSPTMLTSPERFLDDCERLRLTVIGIFPATFPALLDTMEVRGRFPASVRLANTGGEAVSASDVFRWHAFFQKRGHPPCRLVNVYGLTETTIASVTAELTSLRPGQPVPIGFPLPGTHLRLGETGSSSIEWKPGAQGELWIGGPCVARGYLGRPALTAERFVIRSDHAGRPVRYFRTGDLVEVLHDGALRFHGRTDRQAKVRGYRLEPREIEAAICHHDDVQACSVQVIGCSPVDSRIAAYVVLRPGREAAATIDRLRDQLRLQLPAWLQPDSIAPVDAIPLTRSGKVDAATLELMCPTDPQREPTPSTSAHVSFASTEADVLATFRVVLGVRAIGVGESFFDHGDSLQALDLLERLSRLTGVDLPLHDFVAAPTADGVIQALRTARPEDRVACVTLRPGTGDRPPLVCLPNYTGEVAVYRDLAACMPADRAVLALRLPPATSTHFPTRPSMKDLVTEFLDALGSLDRFHLIGFSWGGLAALDLATRVADQSGWSPWVGLIGTQARARRISTMHRAVHFAAHLAGFASRQLASRVGRLLQRRVQLQERAGVVDNTQALAFRERVVHLRAIGHAYAPAGSHRGPLVVFRHRVRPHPLHPELALRDYGWSGLAGTPTTVREIPGSHHSAMYDPYVRVLTELLAIELSSADLRPGPVIGHR